MSQKRPSQTNPPRRKAAAPVGERRRSAPRAGQDAATIARRKKAAARRRKEQMRRRIALIAGAGLLLVLLIVALPLLGVGNNSQRDMTTSGGQTPEPNQVVAAALADQSDTSSYTPESTPTPVPTPEPTPEPTLTPLPTPTPYVYQTAGRKINPNKKMIALTFDDGPSASVTPKLLDVLKKAKVKATFFMLGENATKNPQIVQRVKEEGHQIATHTYGHLSLIRLTEDEMLTEVAKSIWAIEDAGGGTPTLLRPPYGNVNDLVRETLQLPLINWSVDTLDWESKDAKKIYKKIMDNTSDGSIVLMHDLYSSTVKAIEKAIPALKKKGYQFVTVDELFELKGYQLEFGQVYYSAK